MNSVLAAAAHTLSAEEVQRRLGTDAGSGLTDQEAAARRARFGPNSLSAAARTSWPRILLDQFTSFLIWLLLAGAAVAFLVGEPTDAIAILVIVGLNGALGFIEELRADRAMEALRALTPPHARVLRQGRRRVLDAAELVPGDVVLLEAGDAVPADVRLIAAETLLVEEAALTGESVPVLKDTRAIDDPDLPVGDRTPMAHAGTLVTNGRATAVVTATGRDTEVGRIASLIESAEERRTPLQRRLDVFGRRLGYIALGICVLVFALGILRHEELVTMLLIAVSLAVAAVPEALPAVVTIALAMGARRMAREEALLRHLPAVETLGSVTVIASDKTGTLTLNRMTLVEVLAAGSRWVVEDAGEAGGGSFRDAAGGGVDVGTEPALRALLVAGALCNDAELDAVRESSGRTRHAGDPTEAALLVAARTAGIEPAALREASRREGEIPFDSDRKMMTTIHAGKHGRQVYAKGALESVLVRSDRVLLAAGEAPLDETRRASIARAAESMAARGLRVLALASRSASPGARPESLESDLLLLGLVGILDPPREEVARTVASCHAAGIRPIMITGDHPLTGREIARNLGILRDGDEVLTGQDLDTLSDDALSARLARVTVFARVSPAHKTRIVRLLQGLGEIVAMTGDGVNDAPALKQADMGVAMGITGTDAAREASDMVLLDDRYATIVRAVQEGRRIYDNVRRFVRFILTGNSAELAVMLAGPFLGMPLALLPVQILWINLVTDGPPAVALALERAEPDVMQRPPRRPAESLFAGGVGLHILWAGTLIAAACLLTAFLAPMAADGNPEDTRRTILFSSLVAAQMAHILAIRSDRRPLMQQGVASNPTLIGAVLGMLLLQAAIVYVPALQPVFHTVPLAPATLALTLVPALLIITAVELEKLLRRRTRA